MDAYRFVVSFRREKRSDPDAPAIWRGWVQRIYPANDPAGAPDRRYFSDVADLSGVVIQMIRDAGGRDGD